MKKKYFYFVLLGIMLLMITACAPTVSNTPPIAPSNPEPSNGESGVSVKPLLNWSLGFDSDGDSVKYDLYFGTTQTNLSLRANDLTVNFYKFTESLDEGRRYYWKVVAKDGKGGQTEGPVWSFTTEEISTKTVPKLPTNLSAQVLSSTEIKLTRTDNSDNEDGFKIERKLGINGSWSQIKTVGANTTQYTDRGLGPNTTYY